MSQRDGAIESDRNQSDLKSGLGHLGRAHRIRDSRNHGYHHAAI